MACPRTGDTVTEDDVRNEAASCGIDPDIAVEQIRNESRFHCDATSPAGALGLTQFMPATWAEWGAGDPCDCWQSLGAWCGYMQWCLDQAGGSYYNALKMYNGGFSNSVLSDTYAQQIMTAAGKNFALLQGGAGDAAAGAPSTTGGAGSAGTVAIVALGAVVLLAVLNS
jgi:hypothetical protein